LNVVSEMSERTRIVVCFSSIEIVSWTLSVGKTNQNAMASFGTVVVLLRVISVSGGTGGMSREVISTPFLGFTGLRVGGGGCTSSRAASNAVIFIEARS
jgi:hypothetical protein